MTRHRSHTHGRLHPGVLGVLLAAAFLPLFQGTAAAQNDAAQDDAQVLDPEAAEPAESSDLSSDTREEQPTQPTQPTEKDHPPEYWEELALAAQEILEATDDSSIVALASKLLGLSLLRHEEVDHLRVRDALLGSLEAAHGRIGLGALPAYHKLLAATDDEVEALSRETLEVLRGLVAEAREDPGRRDEKSANMVRVPLCRIRSVLELDAPPLEVELPRDLKRHEISKPVKFYTPQPTYTDEARAQRVEGPVVVSALIDGEGCVPSVKVVEGLHPGLDGNTLETVGKWVFVPATYRGLREEFRGVTLPVSYQLTVNFELPQKAKKKRR